MRSIIDAAVLLAGQFAAACVVGLFLFIMIVTKWEVPADEE